MFVITKEIIGPVCRKKTFQFCNKNSRDEKHFKFVMKKPFKFKIKHKSLAVTLYYCGGKPRFFYIKMYLRRIRYLISGMFSKKTKYSGPIGKIIIK